MTAQGSEELALQALLSGASDYVPSRGLRKNLSNRSRAGLPWLVTGPHHRLGQCLRQQSFRYALYNDVLLFAPLVGRCQQLAFDLGLVDEAESHRVGRAVLEALANAMYHGNLELPGEEIPVLQRADNCDVIERRLGESPYRERRIHVAADFDEQGVEFHIRDEGLGFDIDSLPDLGSDPTHLVDGERRGVVLMKMFMDEVAFSATGNEVKSVKRRALAKCVQAASLNPSRRYD